MKPQRIQRKIMLKKANNLFFVSFLCALVK